MLIWIRLTSGPSPSLWLNSPNTRNHPTRLSQFGKAVRNLFVAYKDTDWRPYPEKVPFLISSCCNFHHYAPSSSKPLFFTMFYAFSCFQRLFSFNTGLEWLQGTPKLTDTHKKCHKLHEKERVVVVRTTTPNGFRYFLLHHHQRFGFSVSITARKLSKAFRNRNKIIVRAMGILG